MNGQPINLMGISPRSKVNLYLEASPISIFIYLLTLELRIKTVDYYFSCIVKWANIIYNINLFVNYLSEFKRNINLVVQ